MKKNDRGFMLVEILLVVTVIATSMIFLYIQISNMKESYEESFSYNPITSIYAMENMKRFLVDDGIDKLKDALKEEKYIDLSNCDVKYITNSSYCTMLFEKINVENLYFTKQNVSPLYVEDFESDMKKFIKYISYDNTETYRIIVKYNDGTFSSTKVEV